MPLRLALNVHVCTDRGAREGTPAVRRACEEFEVPALFLFSLGPDHVGRTMLREWRMCFAEGSKRTSLVQLHGVRALLNGTLLRGPRIGRRNAAIMRDVCDAGFEVGVLGFNHHRWQHELAVMSLEQVREEFIAARGEFRRIFGRESRTAGAPGWQSNACTRMVYDEANLLYASDTRGGAPFFPRIGGRSFHTLEIPSTLPTFDELKGRPEGSEEYLVEHYLSRLRDDRVNVLTIQAESEGLGRRELFVDLIDACKKVGVQFVRMEDYAQELLANRATIPEREQVSVELEGRSQPVAGQR